LAQVIRLSDYRDIAGQDRLTGFSLELAPPFIIVHHYRDGVKTKQYKVISEHMLRQLIEDTP
jgi:hypothetical protein